MQVVLTLFTHSTGWQTPLPALDSAQTLVLVFGEPDISSYQQALDDLQQHYPQAIIAGCSTVASIANDKLTEQGLVVGIIHFHDTRIRLAITELYDPACSHSQAAGETIARDLNAPNLQGVLLLTDGIYTQGSAMTTGLNAILDDHVTIIGGLASDRMQFDKTWILQDTVPTYQLVCGIGFYGSNIQIHSAVQDGWRPFGPERSITRSKCNTLYEIDNRPALELYKEYLGEKAHQLPDIALHFPLAIWQNDKSHYVVRTIININEADNSLIFAGDVPEGHQTQLMYGSFDNLVDGAEDAAKKICAHLDPKTPVLALAISCSGRKLVMSDETDQELDVILGHLPSGSQQLGFYSFGEFACSIEGGSCSLHNETMTLAVIYESE